MTDTEQPQVHIGDLEMQEIIMSRLVSFLVDPDGVTAVYRHNSEGAIHI